jgi:hypothetical protein
MKKELLAALIAVCVLCTLAAAVEVETWEGVLFVDGMAYQITSYHAFANGTITMILEPYLEGDESPAEARIDPATDPRIRPGEQFLAKTKGALVTWKAGPPDDGSGRSPEEQTADEEL